MKREFHFDCVEDCAHLKACRRISKMISSKNVQFTRGCNENCSAYVSTRRLESDLLSKMIDLCKSLEEYPYYEYSMATEEKCEYITNYVGKYVKEGY